MPATEALGDQFPRKRKKGGGGFAITTVWPSIGGYGYGDQGDDASDMGDDAGDAGDGGDGGEAS